MAVSVRAVYENGGRAKSVRWLKGPDLAGASSRQFDENGGGHARIVFNARSSVVVMRGPFWAYIAVSVRAVYENGFRT